MKLLFLSSWFPYPPNNGAKLRIWNLIRQLSTSHDVTLLALTKTTPLDEAHRSLTALTPYCQTVHVLPHSPLELRGPAALWSYLSPLPRSIVLTNHAALDRLIAAELAAQTFDALIVSEVGGPSTLSLRASRVKGLPKILDALEIGMFADARRRARTLRNRARWGLTWAKTMRATRTILRRMAACTVPSDIERQYVQALGAGPDRIEVIPHGIDLDHHQLFPEPPNDGALVFTGSFSHPPNFDAVAYFLGDIYPRIRHERPHVSLKILGSSNGADLSQLPLDDSVTMAGLVNDVRSHIGRSQVSVVPLRLGAGTRLKIIESMALGTPVVSTTKGAEGLAVSPGENILLADRPEAFAQAVLAVLNDPELRRRLSLAGRELVEKRYSAAAMGRQFEDLLVHVVASPLNR